jgi:hypothetical protein
MFYLNDPQYDYQIRQCVKQFNLHAVSKGDKPYQMGECEGLGKGIRISGSKVPLDSHLNQNITITGRFMCNDRSYYIDTVYDSPD